MGMIFDIQRGCTDDGPGIRTTVFLKGCPLRCLWCHNPESYASVPQRSADMGRIIGYEASPGQVMETVLADLPYYRATGGGMTVSGGEPLEQADFTRALLALAKKKGIHTCVETCGFAPGAPLRPFWSTLTCFCLISRPRWRGRVDPESLPGKQSRGVSGPGPRGAVWHASRRVNQAY